MCGFFYRLTPHFRFNTLAFILYPFPKLRPSLLSSRSRNAVTLFREEAEQPGPLPFPFSIPALRSLGEGGSECQLFTFCAPGRSLRTWSTNFYRRIPPHTTMHLICVSSLQRSLCTLSKTAIETSRSPIAGEVMLLLALFAGVDASWPQRVTYNELTPLQI
jgi:hypothetical protein